MSVKNNGLEKEIYLDFDGAIEILKSRGRKVNLKTTSEEFGYTTVGIAKLKNKAPKSIEMLYKYLKENMLKFEDLVKER